MRLVWHKLRYHREDPDYHLRNLVDGLRAGAMLEIDIRLRGDGGFICLHDGDLAGETNGQGPVCTISREDVAGLRLRCNRLQRPLCLEDLVRAVHTVSGLHPHTRIQLDLKDSASVVSGSACRQFAELLRPVANRFILSSRDWIAIRALASRLPGLHLGYDPREHTRNWRPWSMADFHQLALYLLSNAADAHVYYLHHELMSGQYAAELVKILHEEDKQLAVWTLDADDTDVLAKLRHLVSLGVDMIVTNTPEALVELWGRETGQATAEPALAATELSVN